MANKTKERKTPNGSGATGTYVYDKNLKKVVKISDRAPKIASSYSNSSPEAGPCGKSACARRCADA